MLNIESYFGESKECVFLVCIKLDIANIKILSQCNKTLYEHVKNLKNNELFWTELIESEYNLTLPNEIKYADNNSPKFMQNKYKLLHCPINENDLIPFLVDPIICSTAKQNMLKAVKSDPISCAMEIRGIDNMTYFEHRLTKGNQRDLMFALCIIPELALNEFFIVRIVACDYLCLIKPCIKSIETADISYYLRSIFDVRETSKHCLIKSSIEHNKKEIVEMLLDIKYFDIAESHIALAITYNSEETLDLLITKAIDSRVKNYGITLKKIRSLYFTENTNAIITYIKENDLNIVDAIIASVEFNLEDVTYSILQQDIDLSSDDIEYIYDKVKYSSGNAKECLLKHKYWKHKNENVQDCVIS
jgi:hypothetical protein